MREKNLIYQNGKLKWPANAQIKYFKKKIAEKILKIIFLKNENEKILVDKKN